MTLAEVLVQIPDIPGVGFHDSVADGMGVTVNFILIGNRQDVIPLLGVVIDGCPAFTGKCQNALSVALIQFRDCFCSRPPASAFALGLLADTAKDAVPGAISEANLIRDIEMCNTMPNPPSPQPQL